MATDKQIAANRANAQKSTGPKTRRGKARVSRNNLRHGMFAESARLESECVDTFRAFVASFHLEYQPRTATEIALVDTMATARWRLIRAGSLEAANLDHESSLLGESTYSMPIRIALAHRQVIAVSACLDNLNRGESRLQRQFESAFDRLRLLRTEHEKKMKDRDGLIPPPADGDSNPIENNW